MLFRSAEHAVRTLVRIARGTAVLAWSQTGFNRPATGATTPRNLFGFKDGTANLRTADDLNQFVWVSAADGPAWMVGGTYLAARKIYMVIENWDDQTLATQQGVFGRTKQTGAPLSGGDERTRPDFRALGANGQPLIPVDSHVALAAPPRNNGQRILRRGYNFVEGADAQGREQAGLFFIAFARNQIGRAHV